MKYTLTTGNDEKKFAVVDHLASSGEVAEWSIDSKNLKNISVETADGQVLVQEDSSRMKLPYYQKNQQEMEFATHLGNLRFKIHRGELEEGSGVNKKARQELKSSIPGKVIKIFCKPGDEIKAGTPLLILEAMKMENEIRAAFDVVIDQIVVSEGQKVESGEMLIKFKAS